MITPSLSSRVGGLVKIKLVLRTLLDSLVLADGEFIYLMLSDGCFLNTDLIIYKTPPSAFMNLKDYSKNCLSRSTGSTAALRKLHAFIDLVGIQAVRNSNKKNFGWGDRLFNTQCRRPDATPKLKARCKASEDVHGPYMTFDVESLREPRDGSSNISCKRPSPTVKKLEVVE